MCADFTEYSVSSSIAIRAPVNKIWKQVTDVNIEQFSHPYLFRLLGIPKPLRAKIFKEGIGGIRTAYFDNGKSFSQRIVDWKPLKRYEFSFAPEIGFRAGHFFDLSKGPFKVLRGAYTLMPSDPVIILELVSWYSVTDPTRRLFGIPIRWVLELFQRYLLESIKRNSER